MPPLTDPRPARSRPPVPPPDVHSFAALLWRRRAVILLVPLLVVVIAAAGLLLADREYTASARVAVTPVADSGSVDYSHLLGTMADVAESRPVLRDVRQAVDGLSITELRENIETSVVSGTLQIQVAATDGDPVRAARTANAVVASLPDHDPAGGALAFTRTEPATVPSTFSSPDVLVTMLAAVLLGLALAVAAAVLRDRLVRTVDTPGELATAVAPEVLGVLPPPDDPAGVPADDPGHPVFAALRSLRVALEFAASEHPTSSLVVAPVVSDPWNGWLGVNLATMLATVGHRVLLVDANRTDRTSQPVLGAPGDPGLYDLLAGTARFEDAAVPGPVAGLTVVPRGTVGPNATGLLETRFRRFMEIVDDYYDVVLVNADPVTSSDDARIAAIDGPLLLVVPAGRVGRGTLERATASLATARVRVLGTVLVGAGEEW